MLADVWMVMRTEYLDSYRNHYGLERAGVIVVAPLMGVLYALPWGLDWYSPGRWDEHFGSTPAGLAWLFTLGFVLRERSRLSMEALKARHMPSDAILFGMIGAGVGVGLAFWLVKSSVSLIMLNLMKPGGPWSSVPIEAALVMFALVFLISLSAGTGGVLISLGAAKVGQVYKVAFAVLGGLAVIALAVVRISGAWSTFLLTELQRVSVQMQFATVAMVVFAFLDVVLILFARMRFKRTPVIPNRFGT
ncbi:MAG: hypothetical protein OXT71_04170 [Acidobacteriota bacterium]|nr:hypothetical protein [Acidobacteriota bacterium]